MYTFIFLVFVAVLSISNAQTDYQNTALQSHNNVRTNHQITVPFVFDSTITNIACQCADYYANTVGDINHSCPYKNGYGENLAEGTGQSSNNDFLIAAMAMWYNEADQYDYNNPGFSSGCAHFTQLVWKASTSCGCCIVTNTANGTSYLVCLYGPAGNSGSASDYSENVLPSTNGS